MKRILITLVLLSLGWTISAQAFFSCTHRSLYHYNEYTREYDLINGYDENSLFELNDDVTMFTHTTPTIKSTYYITDKEYDEDASLYTFNVRSDVGNKYTYMFDLENELIKVLSIDEDDIYLIVFTIKHMWYDED